ncbi:MAG TPA: hypothetical protein VK913_06660, partial [Erythrobacter sp.]|nr:hypothetical protein [Erythrobacter sp.]
MIPARLRSSFMLASALGALGLAAPVTAQDIPLGTGSPGGADIAEVVPPASTTRSIFAPEDFAR